MTGGVPRSSTSQSSVSVPNGLANKEMALDFTPWNTSLEILFREFDLEHGATYYLSNATVEKPVEWISLRMNSVISLDTL